MWIGRMGPTQERSSAMRAAPVLLLAALSAAQRLDAYADSMLREPAPKRGAADATTFILAARFDWDDGTAAPAPSQGTTSFYHTGQAPDRAPGSFGVARRDGRLLLAAEAIPHPHHYEDSGLRIDVDELALGRASTHVNFVKEPAHDDWDEGLSPASPPEPPSVEVSGLPLHTGDWPVEPQTLTWAPSPPPPPTQGVRAGSLQNATALGSEEAIRSEEADEWGPRTGKLRPKRHLWRLSNSTASRKSSSSNPPPPPSRRKRRLGISEEVAEWRITPAREK